MYKIGRMNKLVLVFFLVFFLSIITVAAEDIYIVHENDVSSGEMDYARNIQPTRFIPNETVYIKNIFTFFWDNVDSNNTHIIIELKNETDETIAVTREYQGISDMDGAYRDTFGETSGYWGNITFNDSVLVEAGEEYYFNVNETSGTWDWEYRADEDTLDDSWQYLHNVNLQIDYTIYGYYPPTIFVNTDMENTETKEENLTINYNGAAKNTSSIVNCSLYINGIFNQTESNINISENYQFNFTYDEGLNSYEFEIICKNNEVNGSSGTYTYEAYPNYVYEQPGHQVYNDNFDFINESIWKDSGISGASRCTNDSGLLKCGPRQSIRSEDLRDIIDFDSNKYFRMDFDFDNIGSTGGGTPKTDFRFALHQKEDYSGGDSCGLASYVLGDQSMMKMEFYSWWLLYGEVPENDCTIIYQTPTSGGNPIISQSHHRVYSNAKHAFIHNESGFFILSNVTNPFNTVVEHSTSLSSTNALKYLLIGQRPNTDDTHDSYIDNISITYLEPTVVLNTNLENYTINYNEPNLTIEYDAAFFGVNNTIFNCSLYINNILNETQTNVNLSNSHSFSTQNFSNNTASDFYYRVECINSEFNETTINYLYKVDTTTPRIESNYDKYDNLNFQWASDGNPLDLINITTYYFDENLFSINETIVCDGTVYYNYFIENLTVTNITRENLFNASEFGTNSCYVYLQNWDSHTGEKIPDYGVNLGYEDGQIVNYGDSPEPIIDRYFISFDDDGDRYRLERGDIIFELYQDTQGYDKIYYPNGSVAVYDERVTMEYLRDNGQWNQIGTPQQTGYIQNGNNYVLWRWFTDYSGTTYNISYIFDEGQTMKMRLDLNGTEERDYRIDWSLDGIANSDYVEYDNYVEYGDIVINFSDVSESWGDITTISHTTTGNGRKADYLFRVGNQTQFVLDPTIETGNGTMPGYKKIMYNTTTTYIEIEPMHNLTEIQTTKQTDRYTFFFEFENATDEINIRINSTKNIFEETRFDFSSFVTGNNWVDFNNPKVTNYSSSKTGSNEFEIYLNLNETVNNITFTSIGELNNNSKEFSFTTEELPTQPYMIYPNGGEIIDKTIGTNVTFTESTYNSTDNVEYTIAWSDDGGLTWTDNYLYFDNYQVVSTNHNNRDYFVINVTETKNLLKLMTTTSQGCSWVEDKPVGYLELRNLSNNELIATSENGTHPYCPTVNSVPSTTKLFVFNSEPTLYEGNSYYFDYFKANWESSDDFEDSRGSYTPPVTEWDAKLTDNLASPSSGAVEPNFKLWTTETVEGTIIDDGSTRHAYWDTINLDSGDNYLMRIKSSVNPETSYDESNSTFTLSTPPSIPTVIYPNGSEVIDRREIEIINISWTNVTNDLQTNYTISYSNDSGSTYTEIITGNNFSINSNIFYYPWNITNLTEETINTYRIQVEATNVLGSSTDESDSDFTIRFNTPPENATITSPANGTTSGASTIIISYSADDTDNDTLIYEVYLDSSTTPTTLVQNSSSETYDFSGSDGIYYIRIRAHDGTEYSNYSNIITFTKDTTVPSVILLSPQDDATLEEGNNVFTYNVTSSYNISYCIFVIKGVNLINDTNITTGVRQNFTRGFSIDDDYNWQVTCIDQYDAQGDSGVRTFRIVEAPDGKLSASGPGNTKEELIELKESVPEESPVKDARDKILDARNEAIELSKDRLSKLQEIWKEIPILKNLDMKQIFLAGLILFLVWQFIYRTPVKRRIT